MPNFTPSDSFPDVPALEDGKPANAAYLNQPHQALVNRTHALNKTISDSGLTRQGATRIREVADEAALKALVGMADGELAVTKDKGLLFRFRAGASSSDVERWVVKAASGTGLWINTAMQLGGGANGLVAADANERINGKLGDVTLEGPLTIGAGGSIPQRVQILPDADTTVSANAADVFVIYGNTAPRGYEIAHTGVSPGRTVKFVKTLSAGTDLVGSNGVSIASLHHDSGEEGQPDRWSATLCYVGAPLNKWIRVG